MQSKLLTLKDLAAKLNCSRTTIWRKVKSGDIPAPVLVCGLTRWKPDELESLIDQATPKAIPPTPVIRKRTRCAA